MVASNSVHARVSDMQPCGGDVDGCGGRRASYRPFGKWAASTKRCFAQLSTAVSTFW